MTVASLPLYGNVVALRPSLTARIVTLLRLDGTPFASRAFSPGLASAPWAWVCEVVAAELDVPTASVGAADGDMVTVDGLPCYTVECC